MATTDSTQRGQTPGRGLGTAQPKSRVEKRPARWEETLSRVAQQESQRVLEVLIISTKEHESATAAIRDIGAALRRQRLDPARSEILAHLRMMKPCVLGSQHMAMVKATATASIVYSNALDNALGDELRIAVLGPNRMHSAWRVPAGGEGARIMDPTKTLRELAGALFEKQSELPGHRVNFDWSMHKYTDAKTHLKNSNIIGISCLHAKAEGVREKFQSVIAGGFSRKVDKVGHLFVDDHMSDLEPFDLSIVSRFVMAGVSRCDLEDVGSPIRLQLDEMLEDGCDYFDVVNVVDLYKISRGVLRVDVVYNADMYEDMKLRIGALDKITKSFGSVEIEIYDSKTLVVFAREVDIPFLELSEAAGLAERSESEKRSKKELKEYMKLMEEMVEETKARMQQLEVELAASRKMTEELAKRLAGVRETTKAGFSAQEEALQKLEHSTGAQFEVVSEQIGSVNGAVAAVNVGLGEVAAVQKVGFRGIAAQNMAGHAALHAMGQHMGVDGMPELASAPPSLLPPAAPPPPSAATSPPSGSASSAAPPPVPRFGSPTKVSPAKARRQEEARQQAQALLEEEVGSPERVQANLEISRARFAAEQAAWQETVRAASVSAMQVSPSKASQPPPPASGRSPGATASAGSGSPSVGTTVSPGPTASGPSTSTPAASAAKSPARQHGPRGGKITHAKSPGKSSS